MIASQALACGGQVDGEGNDNGDVGVADTIGVDAAGFTTCTAPGGGRVCGGPSRCPRTAPICEMCIDPTGGVARDEGDLSVCSSSAAPVVPRDYKCPDGDVMVAMPASSAKPFGPFLCVREEIGVLYARNGKSAAVRYADYDLYSGAALPSPSNCPSVDGVKFCGKHCGACADGFVCTGRSPKHPHSFCVKDGADQVTTLDGKVACPSGHGCFTFSVAAEAVPYAQLKTYCLPSETCRALADRLPGGGNCTVPTKFDVTGAGACF